MNNTNTNTQQTELTPGQQQTAQIQMATRRGDNKSFPCKTYANEAKALAVAKAQAENVAIAFDVAEPVRYSAVQAWGRYVVMVDMGHALKHAKNGGYVFMVGAAGHWTY